MVRDPRRGGKEEEEEKEEKEEEEKEEEKEEDDHGIMVSKVWQCFTVEEVEKEEEGAKKTDILLAISRRIYFTIVLLRWVSEWTSIKSSGCRAVWTD